MGPPMALTAMGNCRLRHHCPADYHTEYDNAFYKAHFAVNRKPGEANPFETGPDAVTRSVPRPTK